MARKTHHRKSHHKRSTHKRSTHKRKTHRRRHSRRRQTRRRGGACPCAAASLMRGGRGGLGGSELGHAYTTSASQELYQMTGRTPGLSSGGARKKRNNINVSLVTNSKPLMPIVQGPEGNVPKTAQNVRNTLEMGEYIKEINASRMANNSMNSNRV